MKKVLAVAAFAAFGLMSCKKDYTCECTSTTGSVSATSSTTINGTKGDAKDACDEGDGSATALGVTTTVECKIK